MVFKGKAALDEIKNLEYFTKISFFEDEKSFRASVPKIKNSIPGKNYFYIETPEIELSPKMKLFSLLIDFDCKTDTSDYYTKSWAVCYLSYLQNQHIDECRLLQIEPGGSFTHCVNDDLRVSNFGANDYLQLARPLNLRRQANPPGLAEGVRSLQPRILSSGSEHSILVDYKNNLYVWGDNKYGQLGLGHSRRVEHVVRLTKFSKDVKSVVAKGNKCWVVNGQGKIYSWPNKNSKEHKFIPKFMKAPSPRVKFEQISCGIEFCIALSKNGVLFSQGKNKFGQLGLGDFSYRKNLTIILFIKELGVRVSEVSAGAKHCVCKGTAGKVFTWGRGDFGQLGIPESKKQNSLPTQIKIKDPNCAIFKPVSVQAGFNSTYILCNNYKIYQTGRGGGQSPLRFTFKKFDYKKKYPKENITRDFVPLKLFCKWSRSVSVCYLMMSDYREVKISQKLKDKITKMVNLSWEGCYTQSKIFVKISIASL